MMKIVTMIDSGDEDRLLKIGFSCTEKGFDHVAARIEEAERRLHQEHLALDRGDGGDTGG